MYLRFVVADIDEDSGRELECFMRSLNLRDQEKQVHEEEIHDSIIEWFNEHLETDTLYSFQASVLSQEEYGDLVV